MLGEPVGARAVAAVRVRLPSEEMGPRPGGVLAERVVRAGDGRAALAVDGEERTARVARP
jgi:hypothetical protein